ncbi:hypothetical protein [Allokutzneria albata]|uniref:Uncharacterized protein n=1 Tax=Allokutzneria albata TaxID=211114 RepID=A0A1G9ZB75_ALLAB|nr:hypothetical protein [Allokutzneria albata]SDN17733.1 hypothetical protein SAMN04489726_5347 [Allokutzneria albata]
MVTVIWIGIAAGLVVLLLMAVSDHMNDHAQPAEPAPTPAAERARSTVDLPATPAVRTRSTHLPTAA